MVKKRSSRSRSTQAQESDASERRPRDEIKKVLEAAFRQEFPRDTVDISDGYQDNIHVLVVSRRFDDMSDAQQGDLMWGIIDGTDLNDAEKVLISLVLPLSPEDVK